MRDGLEATVADLAAAPFDPARWDAALDGIARAGGGWVTQLAAVTPDAYLLDMAPRMPALGLAEHQAFGLDPTDQPHARILQAPLMSVRSNDDLVGAAEQAQSGFYAFLRYYDMPHACLARVDQIGKIAVVVTTLRHARAGHVQAKDKERFGALLPHLRTAARLQLKLENQGAKLALGMMGAVGQAAAVCDAAGRIVAATAAAEAALQAGAFVTAPRAARLSGPGLRCGAGNGRSAGGRPGDAGAARRRSRAALRQPAPSLDRRGDGAGPARDRRLPHPGGRHGAAAARPASGGSEAAADAALRPHCRGGRSGAGYRAWRYGHSDR